MLESGTGKPLSPEPYVSRAKALPAKRSEKGFGDENGNPIECTLSTYDQADKWQQQQQQQQQALFA